MTTTQASKLIVLAGGVAVPKPALTLLWDLEARGFHVRRGEDGLLLVSPRSQLTDADNSAIRSHRDELLRLLDYCEVM